MQLAKPSVEWSLQTIMKEQIKYHLSLIVSIASIIGGIVLGAIALLQILNNNVLVAVICGAGALVCFVVYKIMFGVRTKARSDIEYDDMGRRKGSAYKNLSAEQKKQIDMQLLAESEMIISSGELKKITFKGSKLPETELNSLIGLKNVKEEVLRIKAKMEYDKKYKKKNTQVPTGYHMCFMGSPGTGKTTVARIMAGILYRYNCIKENKYVEVDASFLKGNTPDMTLKRVKMVLRHAKGGVLFIDEAYSLLNGVNAAEIIAEIVKYMEDNKKDFALILAGYNNEMQRLIDANPGLHSRISKYLFFKDYDMEELKKIFTAVANKAGYCVEYSAYERFEEEMIKEKKNKNFGNARSVKNLFQRALDNHAYNVMSEKIGREKVYIITADDISKGEE